MKWEAFVIYVKFLIWFTDGSIMVQCVQFRVVYIWRYKSYNAFNLQNIMIFFFKFALKKLWKLSILNILTSTGSSFDTYNLKNLSCSSLGSWNDKRSDSKYIIQWERTKKNIKTTAQKIHEAQHWLCTYVLKIIRFLFSKH